MTGVEQPRSTIAGNTSRLSQWLALGFFVSIALIALTTRYNDFETENAVVKWALSVLCITLGISGLAIIASCTMPDKFTGTQMEGGMSLITLAFLSTGLPTIMNVGNKLAVNSDGSIHDGNLYFFCWFSLLAALVVFMSYLSETRSLGFGSLISWPVLCVTSFVVMATAIDLLDARDWCDENDTSKYCKRARFAVALGGICGLFCIVWTFVASRLPDMLDTIMRLLVAVPWAAAVSLLTFGGSKAPGREVGSLYFFTWASFFIAFLMAVGAFSGLLANQENSSSSSPKRRSRDVESS